MSLDTVDPSFTGGVQRDGSTDLDEMQIEGGWMLRGSEVAIIAARETLDADADTFLMLRQFVLRSVSIRSGPEARAR